MNRTGGHAGEDLQQGRSALERRAWLEACQHLAAADRAQPLGLDDLEQLALSAYLAGRDQLGADAWTRAHNEALRQNDVPRAVRAAFWLILDLITRGERARANGWIARAQRLLDDAGLDGPERGLLLIPVVRMKIRQGDIAEALALARAALDCAARFHHRELDLFARLGLAQVNARQGDTKAAAALLDELMVAVTLDDLSPVATGIVYCAVIETCHAVFDVARAREWTAALSRWCEDQPDLVHYRGQCLVHRAEILRLSGAWDQGIAETEHACNWLLDSIQTESFASDGDIPAFKYPLGAAFYQRAEIHRVRGDFSTAEDAYRRASQYGHPPEPGLALLRLAQGRLDEACATIRRASSESQRPTVRASILAACVDIMIAARDLDAARTAADELTRMAGAQAPPFLRARSAQASGNVLLAEGEPQAALAPLRQAWMSWQEIEAPWEAARVRVLLGSACRALGDEETAQLEFDAASRVFERLGAAPDINQVSTVRRKLPAASHQPLTRREVQVIGLIATGRTNRAIASELSISERTVDRHVSNILSKLGLPSRAAATAWAFEHRIAPPSA